MTSAVRTRRSLRQLVDLVGELVHVRVEHAQESNQGLPAHAALASLDPD